jgi:tetratricopeptide (TPR) repeat protein
MRYLTILFLITFNFSVFANSVTQFNVKGESEYKNEDYLDAYMTFKNAYELDKNNIRTLGNLSITSIKLGRYVEAIEYSKKIIENTTNRNTIGSAYYNIGLAYRDCIHPEKAIESFEKSLNYRENSNVRTKLEEQKKFIKEAREKDNFDWLLGFVGKRYNEIDWSDFMIVVYKTLPEKMINVIGYETSVRDLFFAITYGPRTLTVQDNRYVIVEGFRQHSATEKGILVVDIKEKSGAVGFVYGMDGDILLPKDKFLYISKSPKISNEIMDIFNNWLISEGLSDIEKCSN